VTLLLIPKDVCLGLNSLYNLQHLARESKRYMVILTSELIIMYTAIHLAGKRVNDQPHQKLQFYFMVLKNTVKQIQGT